MKNYVNPFQIIWWNKNYTNSVVCIPANWWIPFWCHQRQATLVSSNNSAISMLSSTNHRRLHSFHRSVRTFTGVINHPSGNYGRHEYLFFLSLKKHFMIIIVFRISYLRFVRIIFILAYIIIFWSSWICSWNNQIKDVSRFFFRVRFFQLQFTNLFNL